MRACPFCGAPPDEVSMSANGLRLHRLFCPNPDCDATPTATGRSAASAEAARAAARALWESRTHLLMQGPAGSA